VVKVAKSLLSVCDGAHSLDYSGYNKVDAPVVRDILRRYNLGFADECDIEQLRKILLKYKRQIEAFGFDYSKLLKKVFDDNGTGIKVWTDGNILYIKSPYNEDFTKEIRQLKNRRWDSLKKANTIYITHDKKDALKALELVEKYYGIKVDIDIPDVPFGYVKGIRENGSGYIVFRTDYNEDFVAELREIKGFWDKSERVWKVRPANLTHIQKIRQLIEKWELVDDGSAKELLDTLEKKFEEVKREKQELLEMSKKVTTDVEVKTPPGLELYPFQKVGFEWLEKTKGRALIADEMGLGKSITVLTWLYNHPEIRPALIVCPNSVKLNWVREIKKWCPGESVFIIKGQSGYLPAGFNFYVINYDILDARKDQLEAMDFQMII